MKQPIYNLICCRSYRKCECHHTCHKEIICNKTLYSKTCSNCGHEHSAICNSNIVKYIPEEKLKTVHEQKFVRNDIETYEENVITSYETEAYAEQVIYDYDVIPYEEKRIEKQKTGVREEFYTERQPKTVYESYFDWEEYSVPYVDYIQNQRSRQVPESRWDGKNFVSSYRTEYYMEKLPIYKNRTERRQVQKHRNVTKYEDVRKTRLVDVYSDVEVRETKHNRIPKYKTVEKTRQVPIWGIVNKTRPKPIYETVSVQKYVTENVPHPTTCGCNTFEHSMTQCHCNHCTCHGCNGNMDLSSCTITSLILFICSMYTASIISVIVAALSKTVLI